MAELYHKTISKGRKSIVFGMPWYSIDEEESPRKAGVSLAREMPQPFDLIVARKGPVAQFGLASTTEGARKGALSAAAVVAEIVQTDSWLYVLEIDTSIWICCGRDGYILPHGDRVYENRDEARRAFQALNPSSFKKVFLPESWKKDKTNRDDLSDIASDTEETDILEFIEYAAPKWGKLASVSPLGTILQIVSLLFVLGTIATIASQVFLDDEPVTTGPTPEQIRAARERLAMQEREERLALYASLDAVRPWHDMPPAIAVFDACLDGIRGFPTMPVGYDVEQVICTGSSIDASVSRTTGYSSWLREWAESYPGMEASPSSNGDTGFLSLALQRIAPRGPEEITSFDAIADTMLHYGQVEGSSVDITTPAAAIVPSEPEYTPYYAVSDFRIETMRPDTWRNLFVDTPGFAIGEIVYDIENQTYRIEGELYVPNL